MIFLTYTQLVNLGKKCSMCNEKAKWFDKFDENTPIYCDKHYPFKEIEHKEKG